jgi:hypothetical protein
MDRTETLYNRALPVGGVALSISSPFCQISLIKYLQDAITIRFYRILTMVYNTHNYWIFGICPASEF